MCNVVGIRVVHYAVVSGCDKMCFWIERLRQLLEWYIACPLILTGPTRRRKQRLAPGSHWYSPSHDIANIALNIGIDHILWWLVPITQSIAEIFPVGGKI